MLTFEERFYVFEPSLLKRMWRDLRLALWLTKVLSMYYIKGGRIRRHYLKCRQTGQPYWIDAAH